MNEEDKKLLLEMKDNCLNASVYDDENRLLKANAITNVLKEIERLNNIINKIENFIEDRIDNYKYYECYETAHALETIRSDIKELKGSDKE